METYKNPFHRSTYQNSKPEYELNGKITVYKDYIIHEQIPGVEFHIVKDGACVTMRAGLNGARRWIDQAVESKNYSKGA